MLQILDLYEDSAGDCVLNGDDLLIEDSILQNSLSCAGRRISGRFDDNIFREALTAGLERFLFSKNINNSIYDIKMSIIKCLSRDNLFFSSDFDIKVGNSNDPREAKLYIIFKTSMLGNTAQFKVFVDIVNQKILWSQN